MSEVAFITAAPQAVMVRIVTTLAKELDVRVNQVTAAVALIDEGATVPFIARYRKEATGGLTDDHLRLLDERLVYLRDMEERRGATLASIHEQGKLTPELQADIESADNKARLEDLYAPYKQKRRTKGEIAREAGLAPLADGLFDDPTQAPEAAAQAFVNAEKGVADVKAALEGARYILMERFAENANLVGAVRDFIRAESEVVSRVVDGQQELGAKFSDYFDYRERLSKVPSHRALALMRGRSEGVLRVNLGLPGEEESPPFSAPMNAAEALIAKHAGIVHQGRAADKWLGDVVRWTWRVKLQLSTESDLMGELRERAETDAIRVFAQNLKDLLLASPAGARPTLGLDPGLRTGVKVAVIDGTGKVVGTDTIYPHAPRNDWDGSIARLAIICKALEIQLIAIGNGTASRETDQLAGDLMKRHPELKLTKIVVSEAGASVYSASALASREMPDLDVSLRGAVSIARRLQDPLAELVKIDPKSIGVGQYQHDVNQSHLARSLDGVVEDCVNAVGVDVNTASPALLARVSGLNTIVAENIVRHREAKGAFANRAALKDVPRLGEKTFEQAAGFLRIINGDNPLDSSAVHPEAYPLVEQMLKDIQADARGAIGQASLIKKIQPAKFVSEKFGLPTIQDILKELEKPGRDPRPEFRAAKFSDGITEIKHLQPGMMLEGVVTNVTDFGAFIDIGVHQDGLAHVSELADRFIKDPREAVKAGDIVTVRVLEVDEKRKRIALTLRKSTTAKSGGAPKPSPSGQGNARHMPRQPEVANAFATAFAKAKGK